MSQINICRTNVTPSIATQADLAGIVDIYNQAIISKMATAELEAVTAADKQAWFDAHIQHPQQTRPIYVLKNKAGKVIAWVSLSNIFDRRAYRITSEISIYIDKDHQGQGIGKYFIEWALEQAKGLQINKVCAKIFAHNEPSLALFKQFGFEQWGVLPEVCDMEDFIASVVILGRAV